ncbi:Solute carrier family 22 member 21 [Orchesella cincta]|uniref:Solute carrier family 22 member 21 n=1 Tax=Orchesella cincta TaxID=48709 RepID=A0A1D2MJ03_ORCCI|nr:Solute carrier family 22 member 21 [Orchesella cincta]
MAGDNDDSSQKNIPQNYSQQILNPTRVIGSDSRSLSSTDFDNDADIKNAVSVAHIVSSSQVATTKPKTFDDLLESVGGFGTFQWLALVLLLSPEIPAAFVTFSPVFTGRTPSQWQCISNDTSQNNVTSTWLSSEEACDCQGKLVTDYSSIVTEWSLNCGSSWVSDFVTSIQMLGMLTGSLAASQISDWFGRKRVYLGVCFLMGVGQLLSSISPNAILYGIARFICGAGISGFMGLSTIYPMEFLTPKYRMLTGGVGPWGEGIMLLALLSYHFTEWRTLVWITALPFVLVFISVPFLPESPRWLLRNQRLKEAVKAIKTIQRINSASCFKNKGNRQQVQVTEELLEKIAMEELQQQSDSTTRFSYVEFFRNDSLRRKTLILMGIWCSWALVYFGISYNIKNLGGDIHVNMAMLGLSDAIGYRTSLLLCNRIGRRKSLILFMTLGAVFLVSLAVSDIFFVLSSTIVIILCFTGKIGVAAARSAARMLTGESFPTSVRTMGYGITGVAAGVGGILSPQIVLFGSLWWSPLPFVTFGVLSILGSVLSLLLPETAGQSLQDTVTTRCQAKSNKLEENLDKSVGV